MHSSTRLASSLFCSAVGTGEAAPTLRCPAWDPLPRGRHLPPPVLSAPGAAPALRHARVSLAAARLIVATSLGGGMNSQHNSQTTAEADSHEMAKRFIHSDTIPSSSCSSGAPGNPKMDPSNETPALGSWPSTLLDLAQRLALTMAFGCSVLVLALATPKRAAAKAQPAAHAQAASVASHSTSDASQARAQALGSNPKAGISTDKQQDSDKHTAAVEKLEGFVQQHPTDVEALKMLLRVRLKSAEFASGLKVVESLMKLQPQEREWKFLRAQLLEFSGDLPGARQGFEDILQQEPYSARAMQGLASVMRQSGEDSLVLGMVETAVKKAGEESKSQEETNLKLLLAQLHALQGNVGQAVTLYDDIMKQNPKDFRPYLCKGLVLSLSGETEQAEKLFQQFRQRCPKAYVPYLDSVVVRSSVEAKRLEMEGKAVAAQSRQGRPAKPMKQPTSSGTSSVK